MSVAVAYDNNRNNYFNNTVGGLLASTGIKILGNLIGDELNAIRQRSADARQVEAQRGILERLGDTAGLTEQEIGNKLILDRDFAKLDDKRKANVLQVAANTGALTNADNYYNAIVAQDPALGNIATMSKTKIIGDSGKVTDMGHKIDTGFVMPELKDETVNTGGKIKLITKNPYKAVPERLQEYDVTLSPNEKELIDIQKDELKLKREMAATDRAYKIGMLGVARGKGSGNAGAASTKNALLKMLGDLETAMLGLVDSGELGAVDKFKFASYMNKANNIKNILGIKGKDTLVDQLGPLLVRGVSFEKALEIVNADAAGVKPQGAKQTTTKKSVYSAGKR